MQYSFFSDESAVWNAIKFSFTLAIQNRAQVK